MPDDYYVSQYSGEEIDERLTAAHNAVRYDAAQTLTDEQKAQARDNISAMQGIESTDHPGCYYVLNGSAVEWINPPMQLGVEYRTTERYNGKPVYVKLVDFGALPNAGLKQVAHGVNNVSFAVVDLSRSIAGSSYNNLFPLNTNISGVDLSDGYINIRTLIDLSSYNAIICLKYAKNAD